VATDAPILTAVEHPVVATPVAETPVVEIPVRETPIVETKIVETPVAVTPTTPAVEKVVELSTEEILRQLAEDERKQREVEPVEPVEVAAVEAADEVREELTPERRKEIASSWGLTVEKYEETLVKLQELYLHTRELKEHGKTEALELKIVDLLEDPIVYAMGAATLLETMVEVVDGEYKVHSDRWLTGMDVVHLPGFGQVPIPTRFLKAVSDIRDIWPRCKMTMGAPIDRRYGYKLFSQNMELSSFGHTFLKLLNRQGRKVFGWSSASDKDLDYGMKTNQITEGELLVVHYEVSDFENSPATVAVCEGVDHVHRNELRPFCSMNQAVTVISGMLYVGLAKTVAEVGEASEKSAKWTKSRGKFGDDEDDEYIN